MASGGNQQSENAYAGDISVTQGWAFLRAEQDAILIDVRTDAEWAYVGIPDLSALGKDVHFISWKQFPDMTENADFITELTAAIPNRQARLLFLCRSGVRSAAAAIAATAAGYSNSYNLIEGFEGDKDAMAHRGLVNGWKIDGLSWKQG